MTHPQEKALAGGEGRVPPAHQIAEKLTEGQRSRLMRATGAEMGGFGLIYGDDGNYRVPALVERVGINHPIFGSHWRLTECGLAVRAILLSKGQEHD